MPISDDAIVAIAKAAAVASVEDYEMISQTNHYSMPEYWITHRVGSEIARQGMVVACEERIAGMANDWGRGGRFDAVIYDLTEDGARGPLRALIEVKGPRTTWHSFKTDLDRLVEFANRLGGNILTGLLHATGPMSGSALDRDEKIFEKGYATIFQRHPSYLPRQNCKFESPELLWEVWSLFNQ